jgi:hypothetical protein
MTPMMPMPPLPGKLIYRDRTDELIEQIKQQDSAWKRFAGAIRDVAFLAMSGPVAEKQSAAEVLRDSIIALMCCGSERQIEMLEAQRDEPYKFVQPKPTVSMMAYLVSERDNIQGQIDQVDRAKEAFSKAMGGNSEKADPMAEMIEASMGTQLRQRLAQVEESISKMQREMEQDSEPPTRPTSEENSAPEANT